MIELNYIDAAVILGCLILCALLSGVMAYWHGHRNGYRRASLAHRQQIKSANRHAREGWEHAAKLMNEGKAA